MYTLLLTLLIVAVAVHGECPRSTPTMLWSTSKSGNAPDLLQSDTKLVTVLRDSQVVFIFYHPKLSVEQFSKQADVYNVHSDGTNNQFNSLLNVINTYGMHITDTINSGERLVALMEGEAGRSKKRISKVSLADFRAASLSNDMEYVFIELPDIDDRVSFSAHEFGEFIHGLSAYLNSAGASHTMIYTGLRNGEFCAAGGPAHEGGFDQSLLRRKRQLSTVVTVAPNNSYTYINLDNCLLFFSTSIQLSFTVASSSVIFTLPPIYSPGNGSTPEYNVATSVCNANATNSTAVLSFNYTNVVSSSANGTTLNYLTATWQFNQSGTVIYGNWYLTTLTLSFELSSTSPNSTGLPSSLFNTPVNSLTMTPTDTMTNSIVYAPLSDSYHCTSMNLAPNSAGNSLLSNLTSSSSVSILLQLNSFQVQPFLQAGSGVQFGAWNDCDMFFTIPILMSFFTMVLMLFILLFSFCVFSTLNTYDRFDDKNSVISLGVQDT